MRREGDAAMPNTLYRRAPLGVLARLRSGENTSGDSFSKDDSLPTPVYGANGVIGSTSLEPNIQRESILIGRVGACGEINVAPPSSFASDNVLVVDLNEQAHRGWMYYVLLSSKLKDLNTSTAQPLITASKIRQVRVPFPSMMDQQRIADYLDRETAEIDAAVADLDLYVELLEKRRSTLIAETVTGNAVFRSTSEVQKEKVQPRTPEILYPWLSYSDPTWQRVPFASFLRVKKTVVGRAWTETPLLSLTRRGVVERDISNNEGKIPASFVDYQMVVPGDLVMCLFDVDETPRTVGLSGLPGMITSAYTVFDVNRDVADPKYVEWFLIHIDDRKMFKPIYTGLRKVVRKEALLQCRLNLPPLNVQQSITNYLDRETAQIDALIAESTKLRDLLLKRRSVLITEVVTGRKQV